MRVIISSKVFANHLQIASRVLAKKNPMPILDCFLIEVQENEMTITASNTENSIITRVPLIEHEGEGRMCIDAATLLNTIKEISEQPLILEYNPTTLGLKGTHSCGEFSAVGMEPDVFPPSVPVSGGVSVTISSKDIAAGISYCISATSTDDIVAFKNGIYFDIFEDHIVMVATDGRKLVRNTIQANTGIVGHLMVRRDVALALKNMAKKDEPAVIAFDNSRATIRIDNTTIYFRLLETRFPNYDSVIPKESAINITVDRLALIAALKRVGVFCNQSNNFVKLVLRENQVVITGKDYDNSTSAEEFVGCEYNGDSFCIGFGYTFFVDILNIAESEKIRLELVEPERPCICRPCDNDDLLMLIMPMKIEG